MRHSGIGSYVEASWNPHNSYDASGEESSGGRLTRTSALNFSHLH